MNSASSRVLEDSCKKFTFCWFSADFSKSVFCKWFAFCWFSVDFSIGVSVFVKAGSGDAFSTVSGCKGCKTSVVLVPKGGVISTKLLRKFPLSDVWQFN